MLFSEIDFWLFLVIVLVTYLLIPIKGRGRWLLFSSYVFYASWDVRFLGLLLASTLTDYYCGQRVVHGHKHRNLYLYVSLFVNLGLLAVFKYFNFFTEELFTLLNIQNENFRPYISWGVPVGISFYTFQSMSYTLDCYKRRISPSRNLSQFSLYVSFFPQLLAGPIERAFHLLPQFDRLERPNLIQINSATCLILIGLFKKIVVANTLIGALQYLLVEPQLVAYEVIVMGLLMTFIVYCDFGAYTDIARGVAKLFGVNLVVNFRPFYFSKNPTQFWQCWHISLTAWIRDYLFNPLVRSKWGRKSVLLVSFMTMILIGLWHGPSMNWLLWGMCAGGYVVGFRIVKKSSLASIIPYGVKVIFSYLVMLSMYVMLGGLHLLQDSSLYTKFYQGLAVWGNFGEMPNLIIFVLHYAWPLLVYDFFSWIKGEDHLLENIHWVYRSFIIGLIAACIIFVNQGASIPFIYFDF